MRLKWWKRAVLNAAINAGLAFFTTLGSSSFLLPGTEFQKVMASIVAGGIFAGITFFSTLKKCLKLDDEEPPKENNETRRFEVSEKNVIIPHPKKKIKTEGCLDDCKNPLLII